MPGNAFFPGLPLSRCLFRCQVLQFPQHGRMARISVLFVADIASVVRDRDGTVVAGSLDDAVESRDVWTFMRNVDSADPNWVLDETDQG